MGFLDSILGSDDPSTADANNGLTDFQRRQVAFGALGSTGALLLAAGENQLPGQRAQILAQLGGVPGQTQQQVSEMARAKLMNQQGVIAKQNAAKQGALEKYLSDPEFLSKLQGLPPELQAAAIASAKAGDIGSVTKLLAQHSSDTRQEKLFTQQEKLAGLRAQQQQAHDDRKIIPIQGGGWIDPVKRTVNTPDLITGQVNVQPMDGGTGLPQLPQAPPQAAPQAPPPTANPGAGINPMPSEAGPGMGVFTPPPTPPVQVPAPPAAPMVQAPTPLTPAQSALARPAPPGTATPPAAGGQGGGEDYSKTAAGLPETPGRNEEFLKTLPPEYQTLVKRMVNGLQIPPNLSRNSTISAKLTTLAGQYDPSFDQTGYASRLATAKDFSAGASAKNVTSMNTAIQHLGTMHKLAQELNNSGIPIVNSALNLAGKETGDPRVNNFNTARNAVADEVAKVFKGSNLSDTEIKGWKETISSSQSPAQLQASIQTLIELMDGRISALGDQYSRGMGASVPGAKLLNQKSLDTLNFVQSNPIGTDWKTGKSGEAPKTAEPKYEYRTDPKTGKQQRRLVQ